MLVSLSGDSVLAVGVYVSVGGFLFLCMTAEKCSGPIRTPI